MSAGLIATYLAGQAIPSTIAASGTLASAQMAQAEAQKNRDWQEYMSSTAHQREVKDLRLAGLNPILSATGGSGASTPSGSMASIPDIGNAISSAMNASAHSREAYTSAKDLDKNKTPIAKATEENIRIDTAKKISETTNIDQDTSNKLIQGSLMNTQIENLQYDNKLKDIDYLLKEKDLSSYEVRLLNELKYKTMMGRAAETSASASQLSSKAQLIQAFTAQTSDPWRTGVQLTKDILPKVKNLPGVKQLETLLKNPEKVKLHR